MLEINLEKEKVLVILKLIGDSGNLIYEEVKQYINITSFNK